MEMVTENINSSGKSLLGSDFDSSRLFFHKDFYRRTKKSRPFETWGFSFTVQTRKKHTIKTEKRFILHCEFLIVLYYIDDILRFYVTKCCNIV